MEWSRMKLLCFVQRSTQRIIKLNLPIKGQENEEWLPKTFLSAETNWAPNQLWTKQIGNWIDQDQTVSNPSEWWKCPKNEITKTVWKFTVFKSKWMIEMSQRWNYKDWLKVYLKSLHIRNTKIKLFANPSDWWKCPKAGKEFSEYFSAQSPQLTMFRFWSDSVKWIHKMHSWLPLILGDLEMTPTPASWGLSYGKQ